MSNFLFRPISNAISRTLSAAATRGSHLQVDAVVQDGVGMQEEDGNEKRGDAARAALDTTSTTNTVSPPADESLETPAGITEKKTNESQVVDVASIATTEAPVKQKELSPHPKKKRRRRRRRKQSELERLTGRWEATNGSKKDAMIEDIESASPSSSQQLAVTPSPLRRRRKQKATLDNTHALDEENVARLPPRKRNRLTNKRSSMGEMEEPRRTMPRRQATLQKQTEEDGPFVFDLDDDRKPAAVPKSPKRRKRASVQAKLSSDEEEEDSEQESSSDDESQDLSCNDAALYENSDDGNDSDDSCSGEELKMKELAGGWSDIEKLFFLYGLKVHGKGKWSMIRKHVRSRSRLQVKSYGQKLFRRKRKRSDVFAPLQGNEIIVEALSKEEQEKSTPWSEGENLLFLYGLKKLGKGHWQEMHDRFLRSRDRHQIRNQHRSLLRAIRKGEITGSPFTPLKGYKRLIERLVEARDAVMIPEVPSTDTEGEVSVKSEPKDTKIKLKDTIKSKVPNSFAFVATSFDADAVERLALAEVESSSPDSAFQFCIGILQFWYSEVEELLEHDYVNEPITSDFVSLRDGIAKLWCVLVQLTTSVLEPERTQVQGQQKDKKGQSVAKMLLNIAKSCPFVGNHHKVIQARVNLEVDEYSFSDHGGIAEVVENANVRGEDVLKALSFSIDICNDAVRKSPLCTSLSLCLLKDEVSEVAGQYSPSVKASILKLGECVSFIRTSWQSPEHIVTDRTSASTLSREANRLSRIKEALLKSGVSFDLETEYGCDCGCWSVFRNKHELIEHQKTCRGQAVASEDHEKFAWKKINSCSSTRTNVGNGTLYNQMHGLQKIKSESMNSNGGAKRWNAPRLNCWAVEYGCSLGCSSVFATKRELLDHQSSCEGHSSAYGGDPLKKASSPSLLNTPDKGNARPAQLTVEE